MIEIEVSDGVIRLGPLKNTGHDEIAALYNSSGDMRYATGAGFAVTAEDTADTFERLYRNGNEFVSGIYINDIITAKQEFIGIISGSFTEKTIWIRQLAIHPCYRRRGLGTRSALLVLRYASNVYKAEQAYLSVVEDNAGGCLFWRELGFSQTKSIDKVLFGDERPYRIVILQKKL